MAGRNQHYIPQFLQKGFAFSKSGKGMYVYKFGKNLSVLTTSTKGAGATRDFYSNPQIDGPAALDDKITDFESGFLGEQIHKIKLMHNGVVDCEIAAVIVAHFAVRTAHIRASLTELAKSNIDQIKNVIGNPEALRRFIDIDKIKIENPMSDSVKKELENYDLSVLSMMDRQFIERLVSFRIRESFDDLQQSFECQALPVFNRLSDEISRSVEVSHTRVLADSLAPQARVDELKKLNWFVVSADTKDSHFILPDCVVVSSTSVVGDLKPYSLSGSVNEEVALIIMPISSSQLLVGSQKTIIFDQSALNLQFAKCSREFFISSVNNEETRSIMLRIGESAIPETASIFDEDNSEAKFPPKIKRKNSQGLRIHVPSGKSGEAIKKILSSIIKKTLDVETIYRIDGVSVPANMVATLTKIKKRVPSDAEIKATEFGAIELIKVGTEWKCHAIVPRSLANILVQTVNLDYQLLATKLLKITIGRIYYYECWAKQFPSVFDDPEPCPWDHLSFNCVSLASSFYFGGFLAGSDEHNHTSHFDNSNELTANIELGLRGLIDARNNYLLHRNIDQLLLESLHCIEIILCAIAAVAGVVDSRNESIEKDSHVGEYLSKAGLWDWCRLFRKDLQIHYIKRHQWQSKIELRNLVEHVERLMWIIGVISIKTGSGYEFIVVDSKQLPIIKQMLEENFF